MGRRKGSLNKATVDRLRAEGKYPPTQDPVLPIAGAENGMVAPENTNMQSPPTEKLPAADNAASAPAAYSFLEYTAPDGSRWRAEKGVELRRDFYVRDAAMLKEWHALFAPQEQSWLVLRRLYTIAPLLGDTGPDDLRHWTPEELAKSLGVAVSNIQDILRESKLRWSRAVLESGIGRPQEKRSARPMTEEEIDNLVMQHGFGFITDQEERRWVARRCRDLEPYLDDESARTLARNAIQQELNIYFVLDKRIHDLRTTEHTGEHAATRKDAADTKVLSLMEARRQAVTAYEGTLKVLGDTPAQKKTIGQRMEFHDCLSTMIEAIQVYYANGSNELIDGMFTIAEIELLLKETSLRPSQYRPDIVVAYAEAQAHLWEKEYKGASISRETVRRIKRGWRKALDEMQAEDGGGVDDLEADEDGEVGARVAAAERDGGAVLPDTGGASGAPAGNSFMPPVTGGDDIAVV